VAPLGGERIGSTMPWPTPSRSTLLDGGAAVLLTCLAEFQMTTMGHFGSWGPERTYAAVLLTALQTLPIAHRRRAPWPVLLVTGCAALAQLLLRVQSADLGTLGVLIAFYTVVSRSGREVGAGLAVLAAAGILGAKMLDRPTVHMRADDVVTIYAEFVAAWVLGHSVRYWRQRVASLEDRVREAAALERAHIARELHDVVSSSLSVMLVQAGAARANLDFRPDIARACLQSIDAVGRRAWGEMRGLLRLVRQEDEGGGSGDAPRWRLQNLDGLVQPLADAGLTVDVVVTGEPGSLPAAVESCAVQVVREALTNALRHAGPVRASVAIGYLADAIELVIENQSGTPTGAPPPSTGDARHGLVGLRERVDLLGGRFSARAGPHRFTVTARLPTSGPRP
jgi:signal transduction histidine kinase